MGGSISGCQNLQSLRLLYQHFNICMQERDQPPRRKHLAESVVYWRIVEVDQVHSLDAIM